MDDVATPEVDARPGPTWEAPGPGTWVLDPSHVPRPLSRFTAAVFPAAFTAGFAEGAARYGTVVESTAAVVGGFLYNRLSIAGLAPDAPAPASAAELDRLLAGSPVLQGRVAAAEAALAERRWRADLQEWDTAVKPALQALHRALAEVNVRLLDDTALARHVDLCADALAEGFRQHHRYDNAALVPVGDLVVHAVRWTGLPAAEVLGALAGESPVTGGAPEELAALVAALHDDPGAAAVVLDDRIAPDEALSRLLGSPGPVGAAAGSYLSALAALPVDGQDAVAEPGSLEAPGLVLGRVRAALQPGDGHRAGAAAETTARLRAAVPEEHRARFDDLLAEARLVYRLRDERAVHGDRPLGSLARAALLEAGDRLHGRGALNQPSDALELDAGEVRALLLGDGGPSADEVAERAGWRRIGDYRDVPPVLGPPHGRLVPATWLPPAAARVHEAWAFAVGAMLQDAGRPAGDGVVRGLGVSAGGYEGTARVLADSAELVRIRSGDVLVTHSTGPAFNLVLPRLGALVTDRGGLLSHAAIVAREFGIPAVVGCQEATRVIPDGARVRVDGASGTVTLL
jgi:rifampicin phosphotransferase